MTSPLAQLIADLVDSRRMPAWRITVKLGDRCTHLGRLPAGIAATPAEACDAYMARYPRLFRRSSIRCWPITAATA